MEEHDLLAVCLNWSGTARYRTADAILSGIRAAGEAGFSGASIGIEDLSIIRGSVGFDALRRALDDSGIVWTQVGTLDRWWSPDHENMRGVFLEAAASLRAWQVLTEASPDDVTSKRLGEEWARLAAQAQDIGSQVVLTSGPRSHFTTVEQASRFVREVGQQNGGIMLNAEQARVSGSTLASIQQGVDPAVLRAVTLPTVVPQRWYDTAPHPQVFDVPNLVRVARELGFEEPWGVELRASDGISSLAAAARKTVAATRALLDAADSFGTPAAPAMPTTSAPTSAVDFERDQADSGDANEDIDSGTSARA